MTNIFSSEIVNKGRQVELDIARGLAVLFMVLIHIQQYFSSPEAQETLFGTIVDFVGGIPAAPVFMFLLGVGIIYSRKSDLKSFLKRGLLLIVAGYLLNLLRGTLPNLMQWMVLGEEQYFTKALNELMYVDIFQFSGLAMILFGIIKKFKPHVLVVALFGIGFSAINLLLTGVTTEGKLFSALTGLFWGSNELSFFPFLTWIFYPIAGYVFGYYLIRCLNKNKFYLMALIVSVAVILFSVWIFVYNLEMETGLSSETGYYQHKMLGNVVFTAFVILWLSILYFASKGIPRIIYKPIGRWSKNVSEIYFIHWLFIGWLGVFIGNSSLALSYYFIIFAIIFIASDYLADYYVIRKKQVQIK